ncbi:tagaturonate reductase [Sphingobacterium yanglingense]|uniref:Tagaturonate reductase n=1 Tax=Sphingobacterium yanglingense TaxID=1437280 RepID=A0A4R6WEI6_9SPHI|nr:tagaturonate reductase [Sphingobacterium yanglingense]TDQ78219.1 tagaturonate reductase [Sphingobacterium yanglingense]
MHLNRENLPKISNQVDQECLSSPKQPTRVLLFGTGVLLRALPAFCIEEANRSGTFNGGIVMIKSTQTGSIEPFLQQDGLYTLRTAGIQNNKETTTQQIITCVNDILDVNTSWNTILEHAQNKEINIIISNTTEKGIVDTDDDIFACPPKSFPGKLTSYLYARFQHLGATDESKAIVLPTELIDDNAVKLAQIVRKLATGHSLPSAFIQWLDTYVYFCNTLVDRIVPGAITLQDSSYTDKLAIAAEPYFLWAIESKDDYVQQELSFIGLSPHTFILPSIASVREIKLRILNGTHTLMAAIAFSAQHQFVKDTLAEPTYERFISQLINQEIIPSLEAQGIQKKELAFFSERIIDRFKNPFIQHQWANIAQNYHAKIKSRVLPLLSYWYTFQEQAPQYISFGFAAYLFLMNTHTHLLEDKSLADEFKNLNFDKIEEFLSNKTIWGTDLMIWPSWAPAIKQHLQQLETVSIHQIMQRL